MRICGFGLFKSVLLCVKSRKMKKIYIVFILFIVFSTRGIAQDIDKNVEARLTNFFENYTCSAAQIGKCKLNSYKIDYDSKKLDIYASESFAYQPFLPETVESIYRYLSQLLPGPVCYFKTTVYSDGKPIEELIPNIFRKKRKDKSRLLGDIDYQGAPWVKNISRPIDISRGLQNRHIALWQSHGKYFKNGNGNSNGNGASNGNGDGNGHKNSNGSWLWQRPRLFCTTEDLFTQSIILPYVIPMLENAGANVFTPRERDTQKNEVIVDNDNPRSSSLYIEAKSRKAYWNTPDRVGFAQKKDVYQNGDNPFTDGTARYAKTESKKNRAFAEWVPNIPENGNYAVYVSYKTLPESITNAKYTVFHKGGATVFNVNQKIGGGTWVYLGTFAFDKGSNDYGMVVLSNESDEKGVVCADAVRFGGGMGNIAREGKVSGLPRYLEGARYSAQWAGMPYSVYGNDDRASDYADDINSRSRMINYLSGGSVYNPKEEGLGVPFEMTMALHSDAGYSLNGETIGSLGVYTTDFNDSKLHSGISRYASRDLTDIMITQLKSDINSQFDVQWNRRGMWDKNYSETRLPAVPSMILEFLSHQNFADMALGHDPNFKFAVGRSIYKSILRFVNSQHDEDCVIQPLPVSHFAIKFEKKRNTISLSWKAVGDPLESSSKPHSYIVYTRIGNFGFDNGVQVEGTSYTTKIEPELVYSFKVTAVNKGGESFPSEILSVYKAKHEKERVLIVNGFDRISGPAIINTADSVGFDLRKDPGVPYQYNSSYCGYQTGFDPKNAGKETNGGLGYSGSELEGLRIAGNTFDYPFIHGKAIQATPGYSFVSCSNEALESGQVKLNNYHLVDYILGLQKEDSLTARLTNKKYKTFTPRMEQLITQYCLKGGNILVSGSYVGSDMNSTDMDKSFTEDILKYSFQNSMQSTHSGNILGLGRTFTIPREMNEITYSVPAPDCIIPVSPAFPVLKYVEGNNGAGTAYKGDYRTFIMGFPFESIDTEKNRAEIMSGILQFLCGK